MRTKLITRKGIASYAPTFTAFLALAITFTINACGGEDSSSTTPPNSRFIENSKVYGVGWDSELKIPLIVPDANRGVIKLALKGCDYKVVIGNVLNGMVSINPSNDIPPGCLSVPEMPEGCSFTPSDAKSTDYENDDGWLIFEKDGEVIGRLQAMSESAFQDSPKEGWSAPLEKVKYTYVSKNVNVACDAVMPEGAYTVTVSLNGDYKAGWNKEYQLITENQGEKKINVRSSLDPKTLTQEVKWIFLLPTQ
jgi:hypothetical protein